MLAMERAALSDQRIQEVIVSLAGHRVLLQRLRVILDSLAAFGASVKVLFLKIGKELFPAFTLPFEKTQHEPHNDQHGGGGGDLLHQGITWDGFGDNWQQGEPGGNE